MSLSPHLHRSLTRRIITMANTRKKSAARTPSKNLKRTKQARGSGAAKGGVVGVEGTKKLQDVAARPPSSKIRDATQLSVDDGILGMQEFVAPSS